MTTDMKKPSLGQGRVDGDAELKRCVIDPSSQKGRVLEALRRQPMSSYEITVRLHIAHPASPIRDLRDCGYIIKTTPEPHPTRPKERINRYHLVAEPV